MNLSKNFTLEELTHSDQAVRLGIDNTPNHDIIDALYGTAAGLERVRTILGDVQIISSSGYRCPKLNVAVHGSPTSQHTKGEADDFRAPEFGTPLEVCREIARHSDFVDFDQLIYEGTWVHISFSDNPRGETLTAEFKGGKATYKRGLP